MTIEMKKHDILFQLFPYVKAKSFLLIYSKYENLFLKVKFSFGRDGFI